MSKKSREGKAINLLSLARKDVYNEKLDNFSKEDISILLLKYLESNFIF